ncbi:hypothetical protein EJ03DRAFT_349296 [Teratosphaeria nubilosa]|uniref:Uncharacterized protein n=1 Tax=Teratosphaeria nubilosa TaxID=161662 RepID=A0A6G1LFF7_9PEZI|nr:hypothetical protein EJ03DRAFT_349296 [Teratosphaeria nubilosa]
MNFQSAWVNYDVKPSDIPPGRVVEPGTVWYDCFCAGQYFPPGTKPKWYPTIVGKTGKRGEGVEE